MGAWSVFLQRGMKRIEQALLIVTFLAFCWLAMQAVHELGHITAAWATRAEIIQVRLHPTIISQTMLGDNPRPGVVVWAGPMMGSLLPLAAFGLARVCRAPGVYLFRFFAGFCLAANGIYLTMGPSEGEADTGVMMQNGSPRWVLLLFGLSALSSGIYLWHREGPHFGLGEANGKVSRSATIASVLLLASIVAVELWFNSR